MPAFCETVRERLAGHAGTPRPWAVELEAHLAVCESCGAWAERLTRALAVLGEFPRLEAPIELEARVRAELAARGAGSRVVSGLEHLRRLSAPPELDGRVVAALHAGFREDRAVERVRDLTRRSAPAELDLAVAFELAPGAAREERTALGVRRLLDVLARQRAALRKPAPPELAARVDADLPHRRPRPARAAGWLAGGTLAAFLLGLGIANRPGAADAPLEVSSSEPAAVDPTRFGFEVVYGGERLGAMSSMTQRLLGSVSGGLSEALPAPSKTAGGSARRSIPPTRSHHDAGERGSDAEDTGGDDPRRLPLGVTQPLLALVPDAPVRLAYTGERLVRLADPLGFGAELVLRERVTSDGNGRFGIDPIEVVSAPPDSFAFSSFFVAMQKAREGFFFRYRDFRIRDLERFHAHYRTRVLEERVVIAERACVVLDMRRAVDAERAYEVSIDVETGLVMRYRELVAATGDVLTEVEFERFELDPTIDPQALSGGRSAWRDFDATATDPEDPSFPLHVPSFVPSGYELERTAARLDPMERRWVEFVYGDGAEQVFFLHAAPSEGGSQTAPPGGRVQVSQLGAWTIIEGEIHGTPVIATGKIAAEDLLLLLESAFE